MGKKLPPRCICRQPTCPTNIEWKKSYQTMVANSRNMKVAQVAAERANNSTKQKGPSPSSRSRDSAMPMMSSSSSWRRNIPPAVAASPPHFGNSHGRLRTPSPSKDFSRSNFNSTSRPSSDSSDDERASPGSPSSDEWSLPDIPPPSPLGPPLKGTQQRQRSPSPSPSSYRSSSNSSSSDNSEEAHFLSYPGMTRLAAHFKRRRYRSVPPGYSSDSSDEEDGFDGSPSSNDSYLPDIPPVSPLAVPLQKSPYKPRTPPSTWRNGSRPIPRPRPDSSEDGPRYLPIPSESDEPSDESPPKGPGRSFVFTSRNIDELRNFKFKLPPSIRVPTQSQRRKTKNDRIRSFMPKFPHRRGKDIEKSADTSQEARRTLFTGNKNPSAPRPSLSGPLPSMFSRLENLPAPPADSVGTPKLFPPNVNRPTPSADLVGDAKLFPGKVNRPDRPESVVVPKLFPGKENRPIPSSSQSTGLNPDPKSSETVVKQPEKRNPSKKRKRKDPLVALGLKRAYKYVPDGKGGFTTVDLPPESEDEDPGLYVPGDDYYPILRAHFNDDPFPSREKIDKLARDLVVTPKKIQTYFSGRRATLHTKLRRRGEEVNGPRDTRLFARCERGQSLDELFWDFNEDHSAPEAGGAEFTDLLFNIGLDAANEKFKELEKDFYSY